MFGYIEGYSDTDEIYYCPFCGERVSVAFMQTERQPALNVEKGLQ